MHYVMSIDAVPQPVRVHRCTRFAARLRGMALYGSRCRNDAWCLQPCSAIHTLFQRHAIDVVFCDASGRVLRIHRALAPWRLAWCSGARCAWEFAAGQAQALRLEHGRQLACCRVP